VQRPVQVVAPTVEAAVQQRSAALHLLERVVLPQHLVAAVRADVVERADDVVLAPHDDDRRVQELELAREITTGAWHALDAAHVEPGLLEDVLAFLVVEDFRHAVLERDRAAAQLGIGVAPVPARRLRDQGFGTHRVLLVGPEGRT
jgi:hypothetical protein